MSLDPMVPFLTGWLMGVISDRGREAMKISHVNPGPGPPNLDADEFEVHLASGRVLRVSVQLVQQPTPSDTP